MLRKAKLKHIVPTARKYQNPSFRWLTNCEGKSTLLTDCRVTDFIKLLLLRKSFPALFINLVRPVVLNSYFLHLHDFLSYRFYDELRKQEKEIVGWVQFSWLAACFKIMAVFFSVLVLCSSLSFFIFGAIMSGIANIMCLFSSVLLLSINQRSRRHLFCVYIKWSCGFGGLVT